MTMPSLSVNLLPALAVAASFLANQHSGVFAWIPSSSSSSSPNYSIAMTASVSSTATTSSKPMPKLPIPEPICSDTPGTWAYDTMSRRVNEEILQRTLEDNQQVFATDAFQTINEKFEALRKELQSSAKLTMLDPLTESASEERKREWNEWKDILQPYLDKGDTWLTAPWMVTEFYVYRRLMEAIRFWDEDTPGYKYDPFDKQKRAGLESSVGSVRSIQKSFVWMSLLVVALTRASIFRQNPCWPRFQSCPRRPARESIWQQALRCGETKWIYPFGQRTHPMPTLTFSPPSWTKHTKICCMTIPQDSQSTAKNCDKKEEEM
jgi:hypothetical protein